MKECKFHGVIPPIVTPIDEHENVDEEGYRALLEYCIEGGLTGILVAGTNGETMALTQKERDNAIRITVDQVKGRIPVMAGCMDTSTRRVIENIKRAQDLGVTTAAVTSIFYDRHTSQDETVRHFERILEQTDIPELIIYNIPPFTGLKLTPDTIIKIGKLDERVVGVKDSSGDYTGFLKVMHEMQGRDFAILSGATAQALSEVLFGAAGFIPALSPCFPQMFMSAFNAARSGDVALTWKYDELLRESSKILAMTKNGTAAAKYAISLRGHINKRVIWPQDMTTPEEEKRIAEKVKEVDAMYEELKNSQE
ncbi:MAG: dihydrodipicolinate synthase family protein [Firmicutes bacterium]|nr:dihydrodipicolinate synthase family protein [Eubacterium sp.]MBR2558986.1 dihydrodipicolinate synthase family protein [Bacillota bacterium]MBR3053784.1 dihydrodipicolinate synthase family protein [Bacillota bacterium]MBR3211504.1 dihydrodipicolinate synthase family protein [Bacillota bacterium]